MPELLQCNRNTVIKKEKGAANAKEMQHFNKRRKEAEGGQQEELIRRLAGFLHSTLGSTPAFISERRT